jgi:hypothetical protein
MRSAAAVLVMILSLQEGGSDRLFVTGGEEVRGEISAVEADGGLVVKTRGGARRVALEDIRRLQFEDNPAVAQEKIADRLWARYGGSLSGSVKSVDPDRITFQCSHGTYALRRDEVRAITFTETRGGAKEMKEDQDNVLLAPESGKTGELTAVPGTLESISADKVRLGGTDHPRERVREIRFKTVSPKPPVSGLFARVLLKNGDGLVGMIKAFEAGRVRLFTHYAGTVAVDKAAIHSIAIVPAARFQAGNMILAQQTGVTEIDRKGRTLWSYAAETVGAMSARKLPNGNLLVVNPQFSKVFELRPLGPASAEVVWSVEGLNYPCDAQALPNGNILVAEYGTQQVAEYEIKDRSQKWSARVQGGITGLDRLDDGTTLASMNQGAVVELDAKGAVRHRYSIAGQSEFRATFTPDGTVLVADQRGAQVIEVDRKNAVLWKFETPQPKMAIRLDDGCTMVLKRTGELVEVDPDGKVRKVNTFPSAVSFSVY